MVSFSVFTYILVHTNFSSSFFAFYSQNLPNHQRDELVCVVGEGMKRGRGVGKAQQLMMRCLIKWKFMAYAAELKLFGHLMCVLLLLLPACRKVSQQNYNNEALYVSACLSLSVCSKTYKVVLLIRYNVVVVAVVVCLCLFLKSNFCCLCWQLCERCLAIIWVVLQQRQLADTDTRTHTHTDAPTHSRTGLQHMCI